MNATRTVRFGLTLALLATVALLSRNSPTSAEPPDPVPASTPGAPKSAEQLYRLMIEMLASPEVPVSDRYVVGDLLSFSDDQNALYVWVDFIDDKRVVDPHGEHPSGDPEKDEPLLLGSVCKGLIDHMLQRVPREPWPIKDYKAWLEAHRNKGLIEMRDEIKKWKEEQKR